MDGHIWTMLSAQKEKHYTMKTAIDASLYNIVSYEKKMGRQESG